VSLHGQRRAATSWSALRKSCANSKAAPEWAIFYILDEPTTGLRFQLLDVLHEFVDQGNTAEGATGGEVKRSS
jgi:ABC-type Na+ transport system ATPase subunit NatA